MDDIILLRMYFSVVLESLRSNCPIFVEVIILTMDFIAVIVSYGMLSPVDGKPKALYLLYGDEIGRCTGHPEYMTPTSLTRVIHKDSIHSSAIDDILKNMMVEQDPQKAKNDLRLTSFSNFLEGKFVPKHDT